MKLGCLLSVLAMGATYYLYNHLLSSTSLAPQLWIPGVMALLGGILVAQFHGLIHGLRQWRSSKRPQSEWRDGDLVGVSGRLMALREPIRAPFSGAAVAITEYKAGPSSSDGHATIGEYMGYLMAPCALQTRHGALRLVGFPLFTQVKATPVEESERYLRAAEYILSTTFKHRSNNPLDALKEINAVFSDVDGEVKADFCSSTARMHVLESKEPDAETELVEEAGLVDDEESYLEEEDLDHLHPEEIPTVAETATPVEMLSVRLQRAGYLFEETRIANGAEITVFGTFRKQQRSIDIGSGLKNLSHSVQLGALNATTARTLRTACLSLLIFGALFCGANWALLKTLGIAPATVLEHGKMWLQGSPQR